MSRPFKPYKLHVEIHDSELVEFLCKLGYGEKRKLIEALLDLALSYKKGMNLSIHGLMDIIKKGEYKDE